MADVGLRDLGSVVPERQSPRTSAPAAIATLRRAEPEPGSVAPPLQSATIGNDPPAAADALGIDTILAHLAELALHERATRPLTIGLLGGPGAGKSFALARLAQRVGDLAAAAKGANATPFVTNVHVTLIDAASLEGDPATSLAARLHAGLRQSYPKLARELSHAARDPYVVLREINAKLDDARRQLDAERRAQEDAGSRRARLVESVLYEASGSQIDTYARANRTKIEARLAGFGLTSDPLRTYKDLVQYVSGAGKTGLALRSLYAFKGQTKLIFLAILLIALGVGAGIALDSRDAWLDSLRGGPKAAAAMADWIEAHIGLLGIARQGAFALAALAGIANLWRAAAFLAPIFKGEQLLDGDLEGRRRDLDSLYAHQTKRVDMLDADVERLTRESAEAERRVGYAGSAALNEPSPFESAGGIGQTYFATVARLMGEPAWQAPQRVVLAVDHLDAVTPARARDILDAVHRAAGPGLVTLVAVDPVRLGVETRAVLARWLRVPVQIGAMEGARDYAALVDSALGRPATSAPATRLDPSRSVLDGPVDDDEAALLAGVAGLAGPEPRGIKRLVDLYRLARLGDDRPHRGALALMLALDEGGTPDERTAVAAALSGQDPSASFDVPPESARLRGALDAAIADGGRVSTTEARRAARRAATFALLPGTTG